MNGLANLIALQNKGKTNAVSAPRAPVPDVDSEQVTVQQHQDSPGADELPSTGAPAPEAPAEVAETAPVKRPGLNLLSAGRALGGGVRKPTPPSVQPRHDGPAVDVADSGAADGAVFSLDDLGRFDASDAPVSRDPLEASQASWFDDEIEATAPDRILEPDLTKQQLDFVESLDGIYQVLNDPEMFGQAVRIVMMELQENKEYIRLVQDQDIHVMIRAMRNTMGLARIKKQEKSRTKGSGTAKAGRAKKSAVSEADLGLLDSIMGGGSLD